MPSRLSLTLLNLRLDPDDERKLQSASSIDRKVSLTSLKRFALEKLPEGSLRAVILSQPDEVSEEEAVVLAKTFSRLLYSESTKCLSQK